MHATNSYFKRTFSYIYIVFCLKQGQAALFGDKENKRSFESSQDYNKKSTHGSATEQKDLCVCVFSAKREATPQGFNQIISSSTLFSSFPSTLLGEKQENISV